MYKSAMCSCCSAAMPYWLPGVIEVLPNEVGNVEIIRMKRNFGAFALFAVSAPAPMLLASSLAMVLHRNSISWLLIAITSALVISMSRIFDGRRKEVFGIAFLFAALFSFLLVSLLFWTGVVKYDVHGSIFEISAAWAGSNWPHLVLLLCYSMLAYALRAWPFKET